MSYSAKLPVTRVSWAFKAWMFVLFTVAYLIFYVLPNFHPKFEPVFLPMFFVDYATPFLPWTFIIYMSDYLMVPLVVLQTHDREEFLSLARMAFGVLILSGFVFVLYPTHYPRPIYPPAPNWFVGILMDLIANLDRPTNCFPSMHVAITGVAAWATRKRGWKSFSLYSIWAVAIFVSTLTTKQHYLLDIAGGLAAVAIVVCTEQFVFARLPLLKKHRSASNRHHAA